MSAHTKQTRLTLARTFYARVERDLPGEQLNRTFRRHIESMSPGRIKALISKWDELAAKEQLALSELQTESA